jgi:hypothetical protein
VYALDDGVADDIEGVGWRQRVWREVPVVAVRETDEGDILHMELRRYDGFRWKHGDEKPDLWLAPGEESDLDAVVAFETRGAEATATNGRERDAS